MLGAAVGDVVGSIYEINNIKNKNFNLFSNNSRYTDDTVMTCAIAQSCIEYVDDKNIENFRENVIANMRKLDRQHINAGYGGTLLNTPPKIVYRSTEWGTNCTPVG